mmetsp:Transcript_47896/g.95266  ORF Transcript_47896/g.95266 Transcript_47896/m.95266 type:complete len:280 (+) Transcript_47896:58-897(+)
MMGDETPDDLEWTIEPSVKASSDGKTRVWVFEPSVKVERQHALHLVREVDIEPARRQSLKPCNPDIRVTAEELQRCSGNLEELRKIQMTQPMPPITQPDPMSESLGRLCRRPLMPKLRPSGGNASTQDVLFKEGKPRSWRHQAHSGRSQMSKTSPGCSRMSSVGELPPADRSWGEDFQSPASSLQAGFSLSRSASASGGFRCRQSQNSGRQSEIQIERDGLSIPSSPVVPQLGFEASRPASSNHAQILCPLEGPRSDSRDGCQKVGFRMRSSPSWHHAM